MNRPQIWIANMSRTLAFLHWPRTETNWPCAWNADEMCWECGSPAIANVRTATCSRYFCKRCVRKGRVAASFKPHVSLIAQHAVCPL